MSNDFIKTTFNKIEFETARKNVIKTVYDGDENKYTSALLKYTDGCVDFANDSREWYAMDNRYPFYTIEMINGGKWNETCDNAQGGICCKWAFHKNENEIRKNAEHEFLEYISDFLEISDYDEWSQDEIIEHCATRFN